MARKKKAVVFDLQGKNVQTIDIIAKEEKVAEKNVDKVDTKKVDKMDTKKVDKIDTKKVDKMDTKKADKTDTKKVNKTETKKTTGKKVIKVTEEKLRKANDLISQQLTIIELELTGMKEGLLCNLARLRSLPEAYSKKLNDIPEQIKKEEPIKSLIGRLDKFLEVSKYSAAALDILIHSDAFSIEIEK